MDEESKTLVGKLITKIDAQVFVLWFLVAVVGSVAVFLLLILTCISGIFCF